MSYTLRPYQQRAIDELMDWLARHSDGNPIVDACVGAGKSIIIAELCRLIISMQPNARIVMCVASLELCQQNLEKLQTIWADAPAGVCSASLGAKDLDSQIIFATIGSIYQSAKDLGRLDVLLIDECHNVNTKSTGMYRSFIDDAKRFGNPSLCVIGFTGTPYRGNGIWLWQGDAPLFHGTATRISMDELLKAGYLSPLVVEKRQRPMIDTSGVKLQAGDYVISELDKVVNDDALIAKVIDDFYFHAMGSRHKFLFYCVSIEHAQKVNAQLRAISGLNSQIITGNTAKGERADILAAYKLPPTDPRAVNCLVSIGTLTTGFDAPLTDCIVLLRPTKSPVLYVQIAGRGMRTAPGKKDCLWLDYTDTTATLGAVNRISGKNRKVSKNTGINAAPIKFCDDCGNPNPVHTPECIECGYQFPEPEASAAHGVVASNASPIAGMSEPVRASLDVAGIHFRKHKKKDKLPTLCVEYDVGELYPISEYKCFEHTGYALTMACKWWSEMVGDNVPLTVDAALGRLHGDALPMLKLPTRIHVVRDPQDKFWQITDYEFDGKVPPITSLPGQAFSIPDQPSINDPDMPF